jgi:hypothetical protein
MKSPLLALLALAPAFAPFAAAQIITGNDLVRIEVRVQTDQDRQSAKGKRVDTVTQTKTLNILLSGKARTPETRKGTWQAYARDAKDNSLVAIDSGTFDIDFSKGPQKVESAPINTTYTPEHSASSGKGNNKGGNTGGNKGGNKGSTMKKAPAQGKKFAGYGITVMDGEKIVGQHFDPAGLKAEAAK